MFTEAFNLDKAQKARSSALQSLLPIKHLIQGRLQLSDP